MYDSNGPVQSAPSGASADDRVAGLGASHRLTRSLCDEAAANLEPHARQQFVDRSITALYRWYCGRSQPRRAWNPDTDFAWNKIRRDLPEDILQIVQGFFAVEHFVPDYACELVRLVRRDYGRSHFYLKWGAEEAKHADLWQNVMLATGYRNVEELEDYSRDLSQRSWKLPFDDPLEMLVYTVFQERATQVNYANLKSVVASTDNPETHDPVLADACRRIATDEVAHFEFFLAATQIYLYFFPRRTLDAISRVLAFFEMPAADIIADYESFISALYGRGVFGKRTYYRDVVTLVCEKLAVRSVRDLADHAKQPRPFALTTEHLPTRPQDIFWFDNVQRSVETLFARLHRFEHETQIAHLFNTEFVCNTWGEQ
jgi:acyl-[acyl-carrier-protein] desaturase